ncbi:GumC family protein [Nafulsella turpanensis]|uniref:GumC family protein n=1 Tax=Nafulsella turpanensis TaxID=1265690 RepID=UPI000349B796|nr:polysaccharide biosynthesis tyrosine autokinase [Nafulsella turpanensis]
MKESEFNFRTEIPDEQNSSQSNLDLEKLISVVRKSLPYVLGIFIFCVLASYLFIRYTKPLYKSESVLQLDIKSEAAVFGFQEMQNPPSSRNVSGMSEEIELIRSKLFLTQVIQALDLDVSYFTEGKILDDEKYRSAPFEIQYLVKDETFFNKKIFVDLLDKDYYQLRFDANGQEFSQRYRFGEKVQTPYLDLVLVPTDIYTTETGKDPYYFILNSDNALIQYLRDKLEVQVLNLSAKTINVSFTDHNAQKARVLVDVLSNLYLRYTEEEKNRANVNKIEFLNAQLKETEAKLEDYENYFESFTIDNRTTNLTGDINKTIGFMLQIDSQRVEIRRQLSALHNIEQQAKNNSSLHKGSFSSTGEPLLPPSITEKLEKVNELADESRLLLESYNENTKAYQLKQKELNLLKEELYQAVALYQLQLQEQLNKLEERRETLQANFVQLPSKGTEFNRIERNYQQLIGFLLTLQERKIEFEIASAGTTTDFKILSSASLPASPISPDKLMINGIGLMAGLFLSLMFVGTRYFLDNKITNISEVERLSAVTVLGALPAARIKKQHASLIVAENPKSSFSEAMRSIRTNMDFLAARQQNRVISVTSTVSGEGKTFVTINLAGIIAFSGKKVVVLDLDMRKPKVHQAFGGENSEKGLSTVLIGKHNIEDCVQTSSITGLDYIPAGPMPPNPSELVMNGDFDRLLAALKTRYDVIVIDTPPVGLVTDGILIMKKADLPLYVFKAEYSKKSFFKTLNRLTTINQFQNMAVILNGEKHGKGYAYGYGYGYGSGYYEDK